MTRRLHANSRRKILLFAAACATSAAPAWAAAGDDPVSALDFGVDPTGKTDSTDAFNAALANTALNGKPSVAGRVLRIPKGLYVISGRLKIGTGQRVVFEPGVRIDATGLPNEKTSLFEASSQKDIEMTGNGAELIGSRSRAGKDVEGSQAAFFIYSSSNVIVRGFRIRDFATDGLYVGGEFSGKTPSSNVRIENCEVLECRRNGLSIVSCDGCVVIGGSYAGSSGAPHGPWAGIDVEPNANQQAIGVKLMNVRTQDNAGPGLLFVPRGSSEKPDARFDVEVAGGESHNDGSLAGLPGIAFANGGLMKNPVAGQVAVRKFQVISPKASGVTFYNWDADKAPLALLEDVSVIDPDGTANAHTNETRAGFLIYCDKQQAVQALGNIRLIRCLAEDRRANPRMVRGGAVAADPGKSIRKVSIVDFTSRNVLSNPKFDFSTAASNIPGGLVDTTVEYTKQDPVDIDMNVSLAEMGGRSVRATRPRLRFSLPSAANCRGLTMLVSAAPGVQGTTIATTGPDSIRSTADGTGKELVVHPGRPVALKSDGSTWVEQ